MTAMEVSRGGAGWPLQSFLTPDGKPFFATTYQPRDRLAEILQTVAKEWKNDADMNFFLLDDPNVVYTFHFYEPFDYTHQLASWAKQGEGGRYPDPSRIARGPDTKWLNIATFESPTLPPGDSPWTHTESPRLVATDPRAVIGHISLVGRGVASAAQQRARDQCHCSVQHG